MIKGKMLKKFIITLLLIGFNSTQVFATTIGGYSISNPAPNFSKPGSLALIMSKFYDFTLAIFGVLGALFFLWSGFQYLTSKGDPKALDAAKSRLTYSVVGLCLIALAYAITQFITFIFGIKSP